MSNKEEVIYFEGKNREKIYFYHEKQVKELFLKFYEQVKHGDDEHQQWLKDETNKFIETELDNDDGSNR